MKSLKLLQVTDIVSPHQLPLARCLAGLVGAENFRFAATEPISRKRKAFGWNGDERDAWILRVGENGGDALQFERWWHEADAVICGQRLLDKIKQRLRDGKLTFYMSERWWKRPIGMVRLLSPAFAMMAYEFRHLALSPMFHFLSIGEYCAHDIQRIASFAGRIWRWGYFTEIPEILPSIDRPARGFGVLWAGRMLHLKRVDTLIKAFSSFLGRRPDATLTLVGDGPKRKHLERMAARLLPSVNYLFLPLQPASEIPGIMLRHYVYVLPSNGYEGWGAVINEAMTEGCVIIASDAAGAAKSMIRAGENGLLFHVGDWRGLAELLGAVADDEAMRIRLAQAGQRSVANIWSPAEAARRFVSVCDALLEGRSIPIYSDGPMSRL
jgi:glycosyltransferase involved in cell wall biosynthesis